MKKFKEKFIDANLNQFWGKMDLDKAKLLRDQVTQLRKNNNLKVKKENESFNL